MRRVKVGVWIVFISLSLIFLGDLAVKKLYLPQEHIVHDTVIVHDTIKFAK